MNDNDITTLEQVRHFLDGTDPVEFAIEDKAARYRWIQQTLVRFRYLGLSKSDKGLVNRYLVKFSGYSRQQITRLIKQYRKAAK